MEKKIYTTYNQINQDFDIVAMTKTEIQNTKNKKHFLVLLDKKDPRPPKESKIDLLIQEFKDFKKQQQEFNSKQLEFNTVILTRLTNIETRLDKHEELFRQHGWIK